MINFKKLTKHISFFVQGYSWPLGDSKNMIDTYTKIRGSVSKNGYNLEISFMDYKNFTPRKVEAALFDFQKELLKSINKHFPEFNLDDYFIEFGTGRESERDWSGFQTLKVGVKSRIEYIPHKS